MQRVSAKCNKILKSIGSANATQSLDSAFGFFGTFLQHSSLSCELDDDRREWKRLDPAT